jgi:ABC-type glutathione transport system ATPase component
MRSQGDEVQDGQTAAVEAEGLVKHYGGRSGVVEAVRGVDLTVQAGEVFGFLGPNGAGKSTTVRMLTTLLSITEGTARVAGLDVERGCSGSRRPPRPSAPGSCWRSWSSRTPPTAASRATRAA